MGPKREHGTGQRAKSKNPGIAQLGERPLDRRVVGGSSPSPWTKIRGGGIDALTVRLELVDTNFFAPNIVMARRQPSLAVASLVRAWGTSRRSSVLAGDCKAMVLSHEDQ